MSRNRNPNDNPEVATGIVWRNANGHWCRRCSICNETLVYSEKLSPVLFLHRKGSPCKRCSAERIVERKRLEREAITPRKMLELNKPYKSYIGSRGENVILTLVKILSKCPKCSSERIITVPLCWDSYKSICVKCLYRYEVDYSPLKGLPIE